MKVRTKILSALALLFALLTILEISVQQRVLMPSFAELEREDAKTSMKRVDFALSMTLEQLELSAVDWGNWADVYQFVQAPSAEFLRSNITGIALKQLKVNVLLIVDRSGNLVAAASRDPQSGGHLDLDLMRSALPVDFPWRRNLAQGQGARGLLRTNQGIMMLAAGPVLDGTGTGTPLGMVIMGRLLTTQQLRLIGDEAQADFSMKPTLGGAGGDRLVETDDETQVWRPYPDIYGKPLMSFEVAVPRRITQRGQGAVAYASLCLLVAGLSALALLVVVLNRVVLGPLARVTEHAVRIGEGSDLSARLELPGNDEVAILAREFDRMVAHVADSRRRLMDQSFQAGFAELAKGVLHNLGNAMTPLGVRVSALGDRLRGAPAAEVGRAAAELAHEQPDSMRRADLLEFVHLGSREIGSTLAEADADLVVIQRQVVIIQTALAQLMHSTHSEHVMESVRLPDLVTQTLEIVPDACRQRLIVQSDESLRRVGAVKVARTVLGLVLQNLIINAADAVRDAGRERGVLHVAAEIVREADREQLHLRCEDDGVGIAQDNLERVFDKGYSTKPRETNHGIGLHWCANAIAGLGGRIWAASDGPGRGASLHLLLPLTPAAAIIHT